MNPSAEVKCRHCGEVITLGIDGKWRDYVHPGVFCSKARSGQYSHEPPIRTVLSTEDRDELQYIMAVMRSFKMWSEVDMLERVLANAGGAE